jgi:hypothetical protein
MFGGQDLLFHVHQKVGSACDGADFSPMAVHQVAGFSGRSGFVKLKFWQDHADLRFRRLPSGSGLASEIDGTHLEALQ